MRKISKNAVAVLFPPHEAMALPISNHRDATSCFAVLGGSATAFPGSAPISRLYILDAANEEDQARVAQILIATAERFTQLDAYLTSGIPYTIRCYSECARGGFAVGARVVAEDVMVDFIAGRELSIRFPAVVVYICSELSRLFGGRIRVQKRV